MDTINNNIDDVVNGEYHCPLCNALLKEKRPKKDKYLIINKDYIVRLFCVCGYYRDDIVSPEDFKGDVNDKT